MNRSPLPLRLPLGRMAWIAKALKVAVIPRISALLDRDDVVDHRCGSHNPLRPAGATERFISPVLFTCFAPSLRGIELPLLVRLRVDHAD